MESISGTSRTMDGGRRPRRYKGTARLYRAGTSFQLKGAERRRPEGGGIAGLGALRPAERRSQDFVRWWR